MAWQVCYHSYCHQYTLHPPCHCKSGVIERTVGVPEILPSLEMFVSAQLHKTEDRVLRLLLLTVEQ